jgi:type IV pilus assembly protein PilX
MKICANERRFISRRQQGAALVVGLILLVVLTLLAVSGMNTASTELKMAGNEQFRKRAFEASEAGIERGLAQGPFNPSAPPVTVAATPVDAAVVEDRYSLLITPVGSTAAPPGYSLKTFSAEHFTIQSQGDSLRSGTAFQNSVSTHTQGLFLVVPMLDSSS